MGDNTNIQDQEDEICVLSSIYTKEEFEARGDFKGGQFFAFVTLPENFYVFYKNYNRQNAIVQIPISHLPPITLEFVFPSNYPSESPPDYKISCLWLSTTKLNKICQKLDQLWTENKGTVILYTWTQFLKEEVVSFLKIVDNLDLCGQYFSELKRRGKIKAKPFKTEAQIQTSKSNKRYSVEKDPRIVSVSINSHLHEYLVSFNEDKSNTEFLHTLYACDICFEDRFGEKCIQFKPCKHVYCKECLKRYFEVRINDGQVHSMPCPYNKCTSEAHQVQIKGTVSAIVYLKYEKLLLNATLDTMMDITYCPRTFCNSPVIREMDDKMATCPKCEYVFCFHCKMTYHGVEQCRMKAERIKFILDEYEKGDSAKRAQLEKLYGSKELKSYMDAAKSDQWIKDNSKSCPKCLSNIEKTEGCNKMSCSKCGCFFCWICLQILDAAMPYQHYNSRDSKCFNKLFEGVDLDDMDVEAEAEDDEDDVDDVLFEEMLHQYIVEMHYDSDDETDEDFYPEGNFEIL